MAAATHPWWPHLFSWPRFLDPISWLWLSIKGYAFTSSGEQISIPIGIILFWRHHNCQKRHCPRIGHAHPNHGQPVCSKHYHHEVVPKRDPERSRG